MKEYDHMGQSLKTVKTLWQEMWALPQTCSHIFSIVIGDVIQHGPMALKHYGPLTWVMCPYPVTCVLPRVHMLLWLYMISQENLFKSPPFVKTRCMNKEWLFSSPVVLWGVKSFQRAGARTDKQDQAFLEKQKWCPATPVKKDRLKLQSFICII